MAEMRGRHRPRHRRPRAQEPGDVRAGEAVIAYHEAGHALVGHVLPGTDPIHKVSIIARGRALGWTLALPTEDKVPAHPLASCATSWRCCSAGARPRSSSSTTRPPAPRTTSSGPRQIARAMVTEYGMSDALGPQQLGPEARRGRSSAGTCGHQANYADEVAGRIDDEVRRLIDDAHDRGPRDPRRSTGRRSTGWPTRWSSRRRSTTPSWPRSSTASARRRTPADGRRVGPADRARARCGCRPAPRRRSTTAGPRGAAGAARAPSARDARMSDGRRRSTWPASRRRSARSSMPSARTPTATGCSDTPARVARMYAEIFGGLHEDPASTSPSTFEADHDEMVMVRDIPLYSAVRAPPGPVHRQGPRRLHPERRRAHHRAVEAGPPGRRLRQAAPGAGAAHRPDRRRRSSERCEPRGVHGRDRGRAPVHVDAGRPQAGRHHRHLGRAGPVPRERRHPRTRPCASSNGHR